MEALAKHDFQATADDELTFARGVKLKVSSWIKLCFPNPNILLIDLFSYDNNVKMRLCNIDIFKQLYLKIVFRPNTVLSVTVVAICRPSS